MSLVSLYIPDAPVEDIVARRIRLELGGQEYLLPTLSMECGDAWRAAVNAAAPAAIAALDDLADFVSVVAYLNNQVETVYELLRRYDELGLGYRGRSELVLPDWPTARALASEEDIVTAFLGVLKRAYPFAVVVLLAASSGIPAARMPSPATETEPTSSGPTRPARPNTAGRRRRSARS